MLGSIIRLSIILSSSLLDVLTDVEFTNDSWTSRDPEWYSPMNVFVDDTGKLDLSLIGLQNLFDAKPQMEDFGQALRDSPLSDDVNVFVQAGPALI